MFIFDASVKKFDTFTSKAKKNHHSCQNVAIYITDPYDAIYIPNNLQNFEIDLKVVRDS